MSLSSCRSRMVSLTRELAVHWRETRESWTDDQAERFERQYLDGLFAAVDRASAALEQLDEIVGKARRDCE